LFLSYLEDLTGIKELKGDTNFCGGGAHKIGTGGKLSLHVDFNIHSETNYFRALNLLLYLNSTWEDEWEGHLELGDKEKKSVPTRLLLFLTGRLSLRCLITLFMDILFHYRHHQI
jgi:Rps23 Pro-64 3,4-dihydroxylase Tpa1-like proline 4-hydroxylase